MDSNQFPDAKMGSFISRSYNDEQDLRAMLDLLMLARSRSDDWHYAHIGDLVWKFFMVTCRGKPQEHIRLWHDAAGELVAYAVLGGDDVAVEWQVLTDYEGRGIEGEAMAWAETRLAELVRRDAETWGGNFTSRSTQDNPRRIAFLEQHGFTLGTYSEVNMIRPLDGTVAAPALPPGCQVRAVESAEDNGKRAATYRAVWYPYSVANVTGDQFAQFMQLPGYDRGLDLVSVAADGAFASTVIGWLDPVNAIGDLGPVGAHPGYRRQGLTRAALLEALRRMQAYGMNRACISTGSGNVAARNLYESIGFRIVNKTLEFVKRGGCR